MPSQARIDANRRNALQSTGPRTAEGKARSARNALRHGLAAISPDSFLTVEDRSAFERMLHGYMLTYSPVHADEVDLLTDAVFCKWRQQRVWTAEAQSLEISIAQSQYDLQKSLPKATAAAHVANAFEKTAEQSQLLRRYEAQLHRQYLRNLKELRDLQASRTEMEPTLDQLYPTTPNEAKPTPPPPPPAIVDNEKPAPPNEPKATWCPQQRRWL